MKIISLSQPVHPRAYHLRVAAEAVRLTRVIANALDYCGVIAVEMFVVGEIDGGDASKTRALCQ